MADYVDAIIELNNGLANLVSEFLADGDTLYLVVKDEDGSPTGLNLSSFPLNKDLNKKRLVYIRVKQNVADLLLSKNFLNKKILAICPAGGPIYDILQEDSKALSIYNKYCFYPELTEDGEDGAITPHPKFGEFRILGRIA